MKDDDLSERDIRKLCESFVALLENLRHSVNQHMKNSLPAMDGTQITGKNTEGKSSNGLISPIQEMTLPKHIVLEAQSRTPGLRKRVNLNPMESTSPTTCRPESYYTTCSSSPSSLAKERLRATEKHGV